MKGLYYSILSSIFISTLAIASKIGYRQIGTIQMQKPAYIRVDKFPGGEEFLLISSFGGFIPGSVSVIPNITDVIRNPSKLSNLTAQVLNNTFYWPNDVNLIPNEVFGFDGIAVPDGFHVPGKIDGNVFVI